MELFDKAVYKIGRNPAADVPLQGELASRLHAAILQDTDGNRFLVDLKSTHGTFLGDVRLEANKPVKWPPGTVALFGSGPKAEGLKLLQSEGVDQDAGTAESEAKRRKVASNGTEEAKPADDLMAALYGGLPDATVTEIVPKPEAPKFEPLPPPAEDPTKVLFLDIDGVLRSVHGRQDAFQNARTIEINGSRVPLLGNSEAKAGIDFWPQAMRALRHIVQKTGARIVLSSDWRKEEVLRDGIAAAFEEYRMPPLYSQTPDLDQATPGVIKALHTSFREKRCKEIRKWLLRHPKVTTWVAVDDIDLSMPDKEAKRQLESAARAGQLREEDIVFLDPTCEFVKTNPTTGLTMDLARIVVSFLNGLPVTPDMLDAVYGDRGPGSGMP